MTWPGQQSKHLSLDTKPARYSYLKFSTGKEAEKFRCSEDEEQEGFLSSDEDLRLATAVAEMHSGEDSEASSSEETRSSEKMARAFDKATCKVLVENLAKSEAGNRTVACLCGGWAITVYRFMKLYYDNQPAISVTRIKK
ncbi:hypothetical protein STEG23_025005 [Scotinomys teguina]